MAGDCVLSTEEVCNGLHGLGYGDEEVEFCELPLQSSSNDSHPMMCNDYPMQSPDVGPDIGTRS